MSLADNLHEQNMSHMAQVGVGLREVGLVAQQNFVTIQKVNDYDFLEGKHMVSLTEALGAREVASKEVPAGPANANKTS